MAKVNVNVQTISTNRRLDWISIRIYRDMAHSVIVNFSIKVNDICTLEKCSIAYDGKDSFPLFRSRLLCTVVVGPAPGENLRTRSDKYCSREF
jgi:hypothetical protein